MFNFFNSLFSSIGNLGNMVSGLVSTYGARFISTIQTLFSKVNTFQRKAIDNLSKLVRSLMKKPRSQADYVKFGGKYLSKRFVTIGSVIIVALTSVMTIYAIPWARGKLWYASYDYNKSSDFSAFTGKVKLYNDGVMIYKGSMEQGMLKGFGVQYNQDNKLIYEGIFDSNQYCGNGKLFVDGVKVYEGGFSNSVYEGEGLLYDNSGKLIYKGNFSAGQKSGMGVEYDPDLGVKVYVGEFANDLRSGKGIEYDKLGNKIYVGQFAGGLYEGNGKTLENGNPVYVGEFVTGVYEGNGKMFDAVTGKMVYKGSFVAGKYDGDGELFDANSGKRLYKGAFVQGLKCGDGELYDKFGVTTFKGAFSDNVIAVLNYIGSTEEVIEADFGKATSSDMIQGKKILTYFDKDISFVLSVAVDSNDTQTTEYTCERVIMNMKNEKFKELSKFSTQDEIESVMGEPFVSMSFHLNNVYSAVFDKLLIDLKNEAPTDKFVEEGYAIRFFYNNSRSEIMCIEMLKS